MADTDKLSALRRKAGLRVPPPEIAPVTPISALGASAIRAGEDLGGLILSSDTITETRCVQSAMSDLLPEYGLLSLVEGAESRFGMIAMDHELVAALIEIQTVGRLLGGSAAQRKATRTDATMCADFIDRLLERLEGDLQNAGLNEAEEISGYRYAMRLEDKRAARLALEDVPFRCFQARFKLGDGPRVGSLVLFLPIKVATPRDETGTKTSGAKTDQVPDVVLAAQTELNGIMHRMRLSLADITGLEVGKVLTLPLGALSAVSLVDLSGTAVAQCQLGQAQGKRALRIGPFRGSPAALVDTGPAEGAILSGDPLPKKDNSADAGREIDALIPSETGIGEPV